MANVEVLIGRSAGKGGFEIPASYTEVSKIHAKIYRGEGKIVYLEDLESSGGTWVDGLKIKRKKISPESRIVLGARDGYVLDSAALLKMLPVSDEEFNEGILKLKDMYDDYQRLSTELQTKAQESMMSKRQLPTMLFGAVITLLGIVLPSSLTMKAWIGGVAAVLTIIVFFLATKWASASSKKIKNQITQLNEKFEMEYICPACGSSFRGRSWSYLQSLGKCPACKRQFKI